MSEVMAITMDALDYSIKSQIADFIYMTMQSLHEKVDVTSDEFKEAMDSGLRDDLRSQIKEYYSFMGDSIVVDISDSEFYVLHANRVLC